MHFIGSTIGVDDAVIINDINYAAVSGPSFTPGVGGTYKQSPPSFKPPTPELAQWDVQEPSQGCEKTIAAGWRTPSYCTEKTVTCNMDRPLEPQRHIDPGRLQLMERCAFVKKQPPKLKEQHKLRAINWALVAAAVYLIFIVLFSKRSSFRLLK
jgi:hypothetical protein